MQQHATVAEQASVILVSADGSYWADCFINLYEGAEFGAGMEAVYPMGLDERSRGIKWSEGYTCVDLDGPPTPACSTFKVNYTDRVSDEVASVAFTTADERTTTVTAVDGFVLFAYEGAVPADMPKRETGSGPILHWLERITYLAADGTPLAGKDVGEFRNKAKVGNLPLLDAYPSQRGAPVR